MSTILLVEDEPSLVDSLTFRLTGEGFQVTAVSNGEEALSEVARHSPDLIILDVMLPGLDGKEVCRELRARRYQRPILMLTARSTEMDKVVGLEVGADDYITKPFGTPELIARVRAHLRRYQRLTEKGEVVRPESGGVILDRELREARLGEQAVSLSPIEFDLLDYFMRHPDKTLERRTLLREVWGYPCGGDPSAVNVAVQRLREKLRPADPIVTIRGAGYLFRSS